VVPNSEVVPSPAQVYGKALLDIGKQWKKVPALLQKARQMEVPPTQNPDGSKTYHVMLGYSSGLIDIMQFFPKHLNVKPGDTIEWQLSSANVAPHTITFLNGNQDPDLLIPYPQTNAPPLLLLNPAVLFPSTAVLQGKPLNMTDYFNSGLLDSTQGPTSFSLKVGNILGKVPYQCLLHDTSGMVGDVTVSN